MGDGRSAGAPCMIGVGVALTPPSLPLSYTAPSLRLLSSRALTRSLLKQDRRPALRIGVRRLLGIAQQLNAPEVELEPIRPEQLLQGGFARLLGLTILRRAGAEGFQISP